MFPMTVTVNNTAQLSAIMAALNVEQIIATPAAAKTEPAAEKVEAKKPAAAAPKQEAPASTQPIATADLTPAAASEKKPDVSDSPKSIAYDDVAKAILAVSSKYGRASAMSILAKYELTTLKDAKPESFAAILADAIAAVGK